MVKLRLKRFGRRHHPFYRLNAIDQRNPRDGKAIEQLGWYDPLNKDENKQFEINQERAKHWLSVGAQPSETVSTLFRRAGILESVKQ